MSIEDHPSGGEKISKDEVNYRAAEDQRFRCGTCEHFSSPGQCELVSGNINPEAICSLYSPANTGGGWSEKSKDLEPSEKIGSSVSHEMTVGVGVEGSFWRSWYAQFENSCHSPGGDSEGGRFCSGEGGELGGSTGYSSPASVGPVGIRLATAKPSAARSDYTPGSGSRMGLDLISDPGKVVARQAAVPGFEDLAGRGGANTSKAIEEIVNRQTSNLVDYVSGVMDADPDAARAYASWYPFAHDYLSGLAKENGIAPEGAIAAAASLSASASWESNVPWAKYLIENMGEGKGPGSNTGRYQVVDKTWVAGQYTAALASWTTKNAELEKAGKTYATPKPDPETYKGLIGKQIKDLTDQEAAVALRGKHESGSTGKGAEGKLVVQLGDEVHAGFGTKGGGTIPQSEANMVKAISVLRDPSPETIDKAIGNQNKVRSFYQNLRDPLDKEQEDVTVDTHHIGAANGLPWTVASPFVGSKDVVNTPGNAKTGALGTYPLVVEATRRATDIINSRYGTSYTPNQVQSVIWEAHKATYPPKLRANQDMQKALADIRTANVKVVAKTGSDEPDLKSKLTAARVSAGGPTDEAIAEGYKAIGARYRKENG